MNDSPVSIAVRHIRHSEALDFTIVAEVHESRVDFFVFDIIGWTGGRLDSTPLWRRHRAESSSDLVEDISHAERYLHGRVKWDGCSDWYFDEQDRVMLHGCSRSDLQRLGDVMAACWDWASELCPNFDA
ncbi:hypothetical protein [Burkholderia cenocepacia]|uniref:hypothetical protein n=1 Tax=Burkholderia cenocepacia TaxID=95486 RepID=UPI0018D84EA4|nr:hypothetical protein [Burkholderia cenocepacia]